MSDDLRVLLDELTEAGDERLPGPWHAVESGDRAAYGWWLENPRGDSSFPTPQDVAVMFNALPALLAEVDRLAYYERAWRDDFAEVERVERQRIRAAVEALPPYSRADDHLPGALDRAAVLAAVEGER